MKIAVTGSSGFVGRRLVRKLRELNHRVIEIDRGTGYNITLFEQLRNVEEFDILIHLAALTFVPHSYKNPRDFYETNVLGTLNVLELCHKYRAKMIFASSYIYGSPKYLPIDEGHDVVASNPYSQSKIIGEQLCEGYFRDFGLNVIIMRPFNIYGPGQNTNFLIPSIITQVRSGRVILKDPAPKRDFVYIDDVVDAYLKALEYKSNSFEIFNIAYGKSSSVREIAYFIRNLMNEEFEIEFNGELRRTEILDTVGDISLAKNRLNWQPLYSIEDGLSRLICHTTLGKGS